MDKESLSAKWWRWSYRRKLLWLRAAFVLSLVGIGLRVLSFDHFRRVFRFAAGQGGPSSESVEEVVWAVRSAARRLPMKLLCLPQALAVKYLLGSGSGVVMYIGADKDLLAGFRFHAWVEQEGKIIIGDLPVKYQPMWVWE